MKTILNTLKVYIIYAAIFCVNVIAEEVKHIVFDLEGVILQNEQEYSYNGNNLYPILDRINLQVPINQKQSMAVTYYIREGAKAFLEYAIHNGIKISILSYIQQSKLNSILSQFKIKDKSLLEYSEFVFGKEAIQTFHKNFHENTRITKDQRLVFDENAPIWSKSLKANDLSILNTMKTLNTKISEGYLFLDSNPEVYLQAQKENVFHFKYLPKTKKFWNEYLILATEEYAARLKNGIEKEQLLGEVESERVQFSTLMTILQYAKASKVHNDLRFYEKLMNIPRLLAYEKLHFKYLIPDFAIKDSADQNVLFLGNGVDLFYETVQSLRDMLELKGVFSYVPMPDFSISRTKYNAQKISEIFSNVGINTTDILEGKKRIRFVETGFYEAPSAAFIQYIIGDRPTWQSHALNVSAFRFSSFLNGSEPFKFKSLEQYLDFTAYVEPTMHQNRIGIEQMRETIWYLSYVRPKADESANLINRQSLILSLMRNYLRSYFEKPESVAWLKKRIAYLKKKPVFYPKFWNEQEPKSVEVGFTDRKLLNSALESLAYQEEVRKKSSIEKYWKLDEEYYPIFPIYYVKNGFKEIAKFSFEPIDLKPVNRAIASPKSNIILDDTNSSVGNQNDR